MNPLGLIGGSAYRDLLAGEDANLEEVQTKFGKAHLWASSGLIFLPRHGLENNIPPHRINHRANILAFRELGIKRLLAVNSVGSLRKTLPPKSLVIPHDYIQLWGTETFFNEEIHHITPGLDQSVRNLLIHAAKRMGIEVVGGGIYIQTTGPRLETRAEIAMLKPFGDVVGMTMAHEATLAKEIDLAYGSICSVDNFCHGITETPLREEEIQNSARQTMDSLKRLLRGVLEDLA